MAALLACPALVAPICAANSADDPSTQLLQLEQQSWDLFKFCFNHYEQMCNSKISQEEGIDTIYHASVRLTQITGELYKIAHMAENEELVVYKNIVREQKFRQGIAMRDKALGLIIEDAKKKGYFNSARLKKALENLLYAIQP